MGINLGDVVDDGEDIHGEGVNIASRIEALADPGGISISGSVYDQVRNRIEHQFEDMGEHEVKHVSAPVKVYRIMDKTINALSDPTPTEELKLPEIPSIAVLPFENMSGDPEQEFFADGMAEDIITELSRYRSLFVIARNSTFAYKGLTPDLREVARDLGVKYVLEGSIRKSNSRIRVTAQLIDGASGGHIWAERYDRELDDIFELQDEITETMVAAIGPEIDLVERERAQRLSLTNLDAWESYQRGLWHLYRFNKADNAEAQRLFREAIASSENFAPAYSGLTHAFYYSYMHGYPTERDAVLSEAFETGRKAVAIDERDADVHFALGRILYLKRDYNASISELEAAVSFNSSFSHAHIGLATVLLYMGEWKRAIESSDRAIRLSPRDPLLWIVLVVKALALLCTGQLDQAEAAARLAARHPTAAVSTYIVLASVLGHLDNGAEARRVLADALLLKSDIDAVFVAQILPFENSENSEYVIEGLHKAGMLK